MKFHDELNQKLFNGEELKPEVKDKLNEIANAFIEFIEVPDEAIADIVLTGSMMSYNYTKFSDIDLHLIVDFEKVHEDCPIVEGYLLSKKSEFNKNHDIFIYGIPVEVYAEDISNNNVHNGLYSLKQDKWLDYPHKIEPTDNDAAVEAKYNEFKDLAEIIDDSEEASALIKKIREMRKSGLEEGGEFSTENLTFKKLRDNGIIGKLMEIKKKEIDKQLSLESYNEANKYSTEEYRAMSLNLAKKVAKNAPKAEKQAPAAFEVYAGPYSYHILLPYNYTDRERRNAEEYARLMGIPYDEIHISAFVGNKKDYADEDAVIIYPSGRVSDLKGNTIKIESTQKNEDSYVESIKEDNIDDIVNSLINKYGKEKLQKGLQTPYQKDYIWSLLYRKKGLDLTAILDCLKSKLNESIKEDISVSDYLKYLKDNGTLTDMEGAEYLVQSFNDGKLEVLAGYKDIEKAAKRFLDICGKYDKAVFKQLFDNGKDIKVLDSDHKELNEMPKYLSYVNESLKDDVQNLFKNYPYKTTGQTSNIGKELDKLHKGTEISYRLDNDWHDCWNYFTKTDLDKYNWAYKYVVDGKVVRQKGMTSWDVAGTIRADGMEDKLIVKESKNESLFKKELTPLPKKKPSLKIGDEVKINGINGKIIKLKDMKMSNTPVYQIKLENGKTVWRYEEELNESVKDVKGGWFDKIVTFENDNYKMECYIKGIKVASCYIIRKKDNNTIMQLIDPKYDTPLGLDEKCRAWNTLREYMQRMADRKNIQINFEEIEGMKEEFIIRKQSEFDGATEEEVGQADSELNAEEAGKEELKQMIADKKIAHPLIKIYKRDAETGNDTFVKDIKPIDLEENQVEESVDHLTDKIDYVNTQLKDLIKSLTTPEPALAESYEVLSAKIKKALGE